MKGLELRFQSVLKLTDLEVNGNHLLSDTSFLEKRRRGLTRFANALVRHPVLSQDQLVVMFLTVPTVSVRVKRRLMVFG